MTHLRVATGLLLAVAHIGCGGPVDDQLSPCLQLSQPGLEGAEASLPAKVSLFFGVETCRGEPVSQLTADNFQIFEDGVPLSPYESRRSIVPRGQRYQMDSLVLLDLSGSILRAGHWPALREAAARYVETVLAREDAGHQVAIYTFDGRAQPQRVVDFTGERRALLDGLASLDQPQCAANADCAGLTEARTCAAFRCVDDSTNLNGALVGAIERLDAQSAAAAVTYRDAALVVFTDGRDEAARVTQSDAFFRTRGTAAHVFTIGLGAEVDAAALEALGKDGFYPAGEPAQLTGAFSRIAEKISGMANRFYLLQYCSPKRVGTHEVKVLARQVTLWGVLMGSLTREFDATGFASGCELSVE